MEEYVNIKVKPDTKKAFIELCKKYERKQVMFAEQVFNYMKITGYDPADTEQVTPAEEIKKLRNTVVSFMRKQESEILKPMVGKVDEAISVLAQFIREEREAKYKLIIDEPEPKQPDTHPSRSQAQDSEFDTLKIANEKLKKENLRLKETLRELEGKLKEKRSKYTLELTKVEYQQLFE